MKDRRKYLFPAIFAVLIIVAIISVVYMNNRYKVVEDVSKLKTQAEQLYASGDVSSAIFKLQAYCNNVVTDVDAKTTLGDWYFETGDKAKAYTMYYEAAKSKKHQEEKVATLSVRNTKEILTQPLTNIVLEITPDVRYTKDMTLTVTAHNLVPEQMYYGKITDMQVTLSEEENYRTTDWFPVDPEGEYLTMSGGFNCAIWQFRDETGEVSAVAESTNKYRTKDSYQTNIYQMARVVIPDDAVYCRVTYLDENLKEVTSSVDEQLTIVYGRLPGESVATNTHRYEIPDLSEGEKIVLENGQWKMITKEGETLLSEWVVPTIEKGSFLSIDGTLPGKVSFDLSTYAEFDKTGIYTISFDLLNPSAVGERLDDAKNLGFNAAVGNGKLSTGENHFDKIYPWSEMKLCSIKDGEVIYSGDSRFSTNGSSGDVFVEIPKFYSKRVIGERYETISISGQLHEGFTVDEAFVTKTGEVEKIYIAAYLTGEDETGLNSIAEENPILAVTPDEMVRKIQAKGDGYREIDYAALSCIQKLFMVETGLRNSQYLFMGICAYSLPSSDSEEISIALSDKDKTNCIEVDRKNTFIEGNNIVIFNSDQVDTSLETAIASPKKITTVIDNQNGTQSVYFSGDPISIVKGKTAIAHVATANGTTGSVEYHTGAVSTARGTVGFKYRHIENLWGNAYVYIDNVTVRNSIATITDRKGNKHRVLYNLADANGDIFHCMVNKNGFDVEYPNVMLPCQTDNVATISTHFGDAYIDVGEDGDNVLYYGGAWNSRATAGLFSFMVSGPNERRINASGRMMYIK